MDNGWIKLHRKILLNPICQRPQYLALWVLLLLKANHKPQQVMWNGGILIVKDGQLITGRKQLSSESGIPETTIEDILKFLEGQGQIRQDTTTKYRVITILNWQTHQKSDSKATAKRQQADTNKNVKKDKNVRSNTTTAQSAGDETAQFIHLFKPVNPSLERLYGRQPQREASQRLLKLHPFEWWERFMQAYAVKFPDRFCPKATTPIQLEEKLGQIVGYAEREKREAIKSRNQVVI